MTIAIPPWPDVPDRQRGRASLPLRYEDITQDGRCNPRPMTYALGVAVWNVALHRHPIAEVMRPTGVIPILSRLVANAGGGPVAVGAPLSCDGRFAMVRAAAPDGSDRYRVDMWGRVEGLRGHTWGPPSDGAGEVIALGEVYGEHTLTRLFASPEERRVRSLPDEALALLDVLDGSPSSPADSAAMPADAEPLDDVWVLDPTPLLFALGHTDSNQHVNSLVYPTLFEEAALRRLDAHGLAPDRFAQGFDIGFRKPLFAGDRARVAVRAYRRGDLVGVVGAIVSASDPFDAKALNPRAHCYGRVELAR